MSVKIAPLLPLIVLLVACGGSGTSEPPADSTATTVSVTDVTQAVPVGQLIVSGTEPIAFDFAPDGRLFFTLRFTGIRWIDLTTWKPHERPTAGELFVEMEPFLGNECGVLGIAVDPEFEANGFVYVYVTEIDPSTDESGLPRVVRFTDVDGVATDRTVIVELPPTNPNVCSHVGGNIHFGPDGYLYLSVGNMERPGTASDLSSPLGKILRVDKADGSPAPDNPFVDDPDADPRVFAYGLRNSWDFAFHPDTGRLYAPDNGPGNCDELNLLSAGNDYGWPEALPAPDTETCLGLGGTDPIYLFSLPDFEPEVFPSNVAPAGVAFVREGIYPQLGTGLLVCEFVTRFVRYLEFGGEAGDEIVRDEVVARGCRFNVAVDQDGAALSGQGQRERGLIYISFDNGIYRLMPDDLIPPLP